jgi:uncharacterized protein YjbI with pentapeptide repeats
VLDHAILARANFERAVLDYPDATGADFSDATLVHTRLYKTTLIDATLRRCWVHGVAAWVPFSMAQRSPN